MKMRRTTMALALFTATTVLCSPGFAKDDARAAAVKATEVARFAATVKGDAEAVKKLLADDLDYCHSNGICENKSAYMDMMTSGKRKYLGFEPTVTSVRLFGDIALVGGTAKVTVITDGKQQAFSIGYTDAYVWRDQRWQMTAWRSTRFPDPPAK